jgi:hypothetical protein
MPIVYCDDMTDELFIFIASHRVVHIAERWIEQENQSA